MGLNEEKAKELSYWHCNEKSCGGHECKNCPKAKIDEAIIQMAEWKEKQIIEKANKWFQENLTPHTDWTGTRIETNFKCESLDELFNLFQKAMEEQL